MPSSPDAIIMVITPTAVAGAGGRTGAAGVDRSSVDIICTYLFICCRLFHFTNWSAGLLRRLNYSFFFVKLFKFICVKFIVYESSFSIRPIQSPTPDHRSRPAAARLGDGGWLAELAFLFHRRIVIVGVRIAHSLPSSPFVVSQMTATIRFSCPSNEDHFYIV